MIAATGLIHLLLAPEYLGEQAYIGIGFILGGIACAGVAVALWRGVAVPGAWAIGALVCVGMAAGFMLSRTVGLPGFHESEWEASGLLSVLLELGFAGTWLASLRSPEGRSLRTA